MLDGVRDVVERRHERDLREKAQRMLDELDPESQEGLWFEAFAELFSSRFDAAVAYTTFTLEHPRHVV